MTGRAALIESRPDALKYVIFLSDGEPTYCYDKNGNTDGNGSNFSITYLTSAIEQAKFYRDVYKRQNLISEGEEAYSSYRMTEKVVRVGTMVAPAPEEPAPETPAAEQPAAETPAAGTPAA